MLLDALSGLQAHLSAVVLIGAQAVYLGLSDTTGLSDNLKLLKSFIFPQTGLPSSSDM